MNSNSVSTMAFLPKLGHGSGSALPFPILLVAGLCTVVATFVSAMSILMHLKNYRKPHLQRYVTMVAFDGLEVLRTEPECLYRQVVRIMLMVPLYAIASFISLFSLEAAFFIDAVRDIYEVRPWAVVPLCPRSVPGRLTDLSQAFVIYCFFDLLIAYLGGERSLLILLHGRPPKYPVFPGNLVWREVDVSDPYTFLFLKRGVIREYSNIRHFIDHGSVGW